MTTRGEPMRSALCRLFAPAALAALVSAAPAAAEDAHGAKDKAGAKPAVYVKDGDNFRPATDAELKAAAGTGGDAHGEKSGGLGFAGMRYDLGIYTLIVFGLVMLILSRYAWPVIR